jgi:hypothetical protein
MNSLASKSPIVEGIVLNILNIFPIKLETKEKHVLNAELVPQIHEIIIQRENLQESMIHTQELSSTNQTQSNVQQKSNEIISMESSQLEKKPIILTKTVTIQKVAPPQTLVPVKPSEKPWETFKKIMPMLQDPFVSYIECKGPNQPLSVVKNGRTQITNTFMDRGEIDEYLKYLSERTRVPLVEGVFNVRIDDYTVNAIISNSLEPSFIIKKNLPNPLLYQK